jgi:hypothetical protein
MDEKERLDYDVINIASKHNSKLIAEFFASLNMDKIEQIPHLNYIKLVFMSHKHGTTTITSSDMFDRYL